MIVVIYYRMFSKNTSQRFKENQAYLNLRFRVTEWMKGLKNGQWKADLDEARRFGFQEDMGKSVSTAGNVDTILSEELDSGVTE